MITLLNNHAVSMSKEQHRAAYIFSNASFFALSLALAAIPLFFVPSLLVPFQYAKVIPVFLFTLLALVFFYAASAKRGGVVFPRSKVLYVLGGLVVVSLISSLANPAAWVSVVGHAFEPATTATLFVGFLLSVLVAVEFHSVSRLVVAQIITLGVALVMGVFHIARLVFGTTHLSFGVFRDVGANTIGTWSELGMFFAVATLVSLALLESGAFKKSLRVGVLGTFILSLVMLALVNMPLIWYTLGLLSLGMCLYFLPKISYRALTVCIIAALFVIPFTANPIRGALSHISSINFVDVRPSWSGTWHVAKNTLAHDALLGAGPNRFATQWELYRPDINATNFWNTAFTSGVGFIPTALVEMGILGFLGWVVFLVLVALLVLRVFRTKTEDNRLAFVMVSSAVSVVFLWTMNVFYSSNIPLFFLTLFSTGLLVATAQTAGIVSYEWFQFKQRPRTGLAVVVVIIVLVILTGVTTYVAFAKGRAYMYFQTAVDKVNGGGDIAQAEQDIDRAIAIDPSDNFLRTKSEINLTKFNAIVSGLTGEDSVTDQIRTESLNTIQAAGDAARDAQVRDPRNFINWMALARVYGVMTSVGVNQARETALSLYQESVTRSPQNPYIFLNIAQFEFAQKKYDKAREAVAEALKRKGNYAEAVFLLAQIDVADGNISQAISSVEKLATISPNDPSVFFRLGLLKYDQKNYTGAAAALERAIGLAPDYANAKYFLGLSYYYTKKTTEAIALFTQLKATNPENTEVKLILENLQAGRGPFEAAQPPVDTKPQKRKTPPVKES